MAASTKFYRELAALFAIDVTNARSDSDGVVRAVESVIKSAAVALKADNPRFRYETFFKACGLDAEGKVAQ